jgi:hypothetical protein
MIGKEDYGQTASEPLHRTLYKRLTIFASPAGMSLTKPSLAGKNLIIPCHCQEEFGKCHPGWKRENC